MANSSPNNCFVSITPGHLIDASSVCQQSPESFDSMFSRLEFSKEVQKQGQRTEGGMEMIGE